jgi:hypothetical protein
LSDGGEKEALAQHPTKKQRVVRGIPVEESWGILLLSPLQAGGVVTHGLPLAWRSFPAPALVFVAGQAVAAYVAFWGGVHVTGVAGRTLPPGLWRD